LLEFLCFHHLYRHLLLCLYVYALEHGGVHPSPYLILQVVVLDRFSHLFNYYIIHSWANYQTDDQDIREKGSEKSKVDKIQIYGEKEIDYIGLFLEDSLIFRYYF
jgi:hypothetical protein